MVRRTSRRPYRAHRGATPRVYYAHRPSVHDRVYGAHLRRALRPHPPSSVIKTKKPRKKGYHVKVKHHRKGYHFHIKHHRKGYHFHIKHHKKYHVRHGFHVKHFHIHRKKLHGEGGGAVPVPGDTSTAVDRETAWLNTTGDGLPSLPVSAGGPWEIIQAYWPRPLQAKSTGIYVLRARLTETRFANIRRIDTYGFLLRLIWPVRVASGLPQDEQRNLDAAVALIAERVRGPVLNKTHGGQFLSVGEAPVSSPHFEVEFTDPEHTLGDGYLLAEMTYSADDPDFNA